MTPIILLDELQKFIEENTADILLECRVRTGPATGKERAAHKILAEFSSRYAVLVAARRVYRVQEAHRAVSHELHSEV